MPAGECWPEILNFVCVFSLSMVVPEESATTLQHSCLLAQESQRSEKITVIGKKRVRNAIIPYISQISFVPQYVAYYDNICFSVYQKQMGFLLFFSVFFNQV